MTDDEIKKVRAAMGLPGWRWDMPWCSLPDEHGRVWRRNCSTEDSGSGWTQVAGRRIRSRYNPSALVIDPRDHGSAGCLVALCGDVSADLSGGYGGPAVFNDGKECGRGPSLGWACIELALALGKWPGGLDD